MHDRPPILLSALSLAFGAGLLAQRVPELEPNDAMGQAQPLTANTQVACSLVAGEQDWFQFTLAAEAQIHLRTSGNFAVNPSIDTVVLLYDATGSTRLAWDDSSAGVHSDCGVTLPAGTYLAQVLGKAATTAGGYGLDFVVLPAAPIHATEGPEPNGEPAGGGVPTPIVLGSTVTGDLSSAADVDWYTFTLTGRAVVQAICYDDAGAPQLDNTQLALFQDIGAGVFNPIGSPSSIATSHRAFNLSHPQTLGSGTYAIQVAAGTAATGTAPFHYTKTGKYSIRTRLIDMSGTTVTSEGPEPNNVPLFVPFFNLGDVLTGYCSGSNEEDWWGFAVTAPTTIAIMSDLGAPSPITDTTVKLYDEAGTVITSASSGGPQSHGRLIYSIPQAGIYYVAVAGGLFAATGDYVVYTGATDPMFVAASFSTTPPSTNACPGSNGLRPALTAASAEVPQLGSTFVVRLQNTLPNAVAVPFLGYSRTVTGGGVPLPLDLASLGAPGCFLRVDPAVTYLALTDGSGVGYVDLVFPPLLAVRGLPFFMQSLQLDLTNNPLGISVTNDVRFLVGERGF